MKFLHPYTSLFCKKKDNVSGDNVVTTMVYDISKDDREPILKSHTTLPDIKQDNPRNIKDVT